jgi:large subunit ribosomal protein L21
MGVNIFIRKIKLFLTLAEVSLIITSQNLYKNNKNNGLNTMKAVVKTGGKQYCVAQGDKITVERLEGNAGDSLALEALMVGTSFGTGSVTGEIVSHTRSDKVLVFKKKRRKNYRRTNGHRQDLTTLKITSITA